MRPLDGVWFGIVTHTTSGLRSLRRKHAGKGHQGPSFLDRAANSRLCLTLLARPASEVWTGSGPKAKPAKALKAQTQLQIQMSPLLHSPHRVQGQPSCTPWSLSSSPATSKPVCSRANLIRLLVVIAKHGLTAALDMSLSAYCGTTSAADRSTCDMLFGQPFLLTLDRDAPWRPRKTHARRRPWMAPANRRQKPGKGRFGSADQCASKGSQTSRGCDQCN